MSDVTPKMKLYVLLSLISLGINVGVFLTACIINTTFDLGTLVLSSGGSFIPFVSLFGLASLGLPVEIAGLIGLFTGIISGIQTFILAMIILQTVSNLIWSPDV